MPKDKGKDKGNEKEKEKDKKKGGMFNRSKTKTKSFDVPPLPNKPDINTQSSQQSQWAWSVEPPAATGGNQDYDKLTPQDREEMLKIRRAKDQVSVISYALFYYILILDILMSLCLVKLLYVYKIFGGINVSV